MGNQTSVRVGLIVLAASVSPFWVSRCTRIDCFSSLSRNLHGRERSTIVVSDHHRVGFRPSSCWFQTIIVLVSAPWWWWPSRWTHAKIDWSSSASVLPSVAGPSYSLRSATLSVLWTITPCRRADDGRPIAAPCWEHHITRGLIVLADAGSMFALLRLSFLSLSRAKIDCSSSLSSGLHGCEHMSVSLESGAIKYPRAGVDCSSSLLSDLSAAPSWCWFQHLHCGELTFVSLEAGAIKYPRAGVDCSSSLLSDLHCRELTFVSLEAGAIKYPRAGDWLFLQSFMFSLTFCNWSKWRKWRNFVAPSHGLQKS